MVNETIKGEIGLWGGVSCIKVICKRERKREERSNLCVESGGREMCESKNNKLEHRIR